MNNKQRGRIKAPVETGYLLADQFNNSELNNTNGYK